ncbi:MAG: DUF4340 domain-containing protein [Verrucomicrobia bacterium]|nr:DUF4340 domain-containing protein [Verrucomicrobiota bacterium]
MKLRTTFILLMVAVFLGIFILVLDRRSKNTRDLAEYYAQPFKIARNEIQSFTIYNGDQTIQADSTDEGWKLSAPWQDSADEGLIDQLLTALEFLRPDDYIADLGRGNQKRERLKDFGLYKPRLRLKLQGKQLKNEIEFGRESAVAGKSYLRSVDEDIVYVVNDDLKNTITKKPEDFRDHRLIPFLPSAVSKIELREDGGEIELRREQGNWELFRPVRTRASNDAVYELLKTVASYQIQSFVPDALVNLSLTGLDTGKQTIVLSSETENQAKIQIGGPVNANSKMVYARLAERNSVVEVAKKFSDLFDISPDDLRDRKIARINPDLVDRISIEMPGKNSLILSRQEHSWRFLSSNYPRANGEVIDHLMQQLNKNEVSEFVADTATDLEKYGLANPKVRITFSSYASENTAEANAGEIVLSTLALGNSNNGFTYARIEQEPCIFLIPEDLAHSFPTAESNFKSLQITNLSREEIVSVRLENNSGDTGELTRTPDGKWVVQGRAPDQKDSEIQLGLNSLTSLRAVAWSPETEDAGLQKPVLTIVVRYRLEGVERALNLKFGSLNGSDQRYGICSETDGTFLVSEKDFVRFSKLLDHSVASSD